MSERISVGYSNSAPVASNTSSSIDQSPHAVPGLTAGLSQSAPVVGNERVGGGGRVFARSGRVNDMRSPASSPSAILVRRKLSKMVTQRCEGEEEGKWPEAGPAQDAADAERLEKFIQEQGKEVCVCMCVCVCVYVSARMCLRVCVMCVCVMCVFLGC